MWEDQFAQVTHVRLTPIGLALVAVVVTEQKAFEPESATAQVIDGIGAGAAQIADGFIGGFRHVDSGELSGAQQAGEVARVAFIGFERGTGLFGDKGRSGDQAGDFELFKAAGDAEAAGAGFIADLQLRVRMSFTDAAKRLLQCVHVIGDGAEEADLALGTGFGDGDGDGVFMDIETDIECNRLHGVVVSSYSLDESERIPRPQRGRSCGSAHPGNPRNNERQPHRFFNSG